MFILDTDEETFDHSELAELLGRIVEASNSLAVVSEQIDIDEAGPAEQNLTVILR